MISEGTIIANSSAPGSAAISVIRLSGEDSIKIVNSFFKPKNNIKLIDFMESIEGPIGIMKCSTDSNCNIYEICNIKKPLNKITPAATSHAQKSDFKQKQTPAATSHDAQKVVF